MGQHQTLPADQHDPPRPRDQEAGRPGGAARDVDQPPAPAAPVTPERLRYRGIPLDGTAEQLHRATDRLQADTVPYSYYARVTATQRQRDHDHQGPLGRRAPEPLDTRQGVER